jgi:hypothetical protein
MHWGITMDEILDIIGNEYVEEQTNDLIQIYFKGSDIVLGDTEYIIPTIISLGFIPEDEILQSAQLLWRFRLSCGRRHQIQPAKMK